MRLGFNWPLGPLEWGERLGWARARRRSRGFASCTATPTARQPTLGGEPGAREDQGEPDDRRGVDRLVEQRGAVDDGEGRRDVGDDEGARGADGRDQPVEDDEGDAGAEDAERRDGRHRARARERVRRSCDREGQQGDGADQHHHGRHPDRRDPRQPVLDDEAADRVAEAREHDHQPAEQGRAVAAEVDAEQDGDPDEADEDADEPQALRALLGVEPNASSAVNRGAEATRIPASDEVISSWPWAISTNGPATWIGPTTISHPAREREPASAPWEAAIGSRTSAASATRAQAITPGAMSRSPISMNR